jgi:hypothetical protein
MNATPENETTKPSGSDAPTCSALDIADIQCHLVDEMARCQDTLSILPKGGTGSLTSRHTLRGAMDYMVTLSNWISRRQIKDARAKALLPVSPLRLKKLEGEWRETARIFFAKEENGFDHRAEIFQHCANELRDILSQNDEMTSPRK